MDGLDFRSFDWDDSELIKAYERGIKGKKENQKDNRRSSEPKESKRRKWNVGDYCRATYSADKSYYEAKIINMNGDFCTVEFLGYGDTEDVDLLKLKESEGKKARKKQVKASMVDSFDESETAEDETVVRYNSYRKKKENVNKPLSNAVDTTMYEATFRQQYAAPPPPPAAYYAPPAPMPTSMPFMAPPVTMPQYQLPPAPPMPQYQLPPAPPMPYCPSQANDSSFSAMMSSWYMAGYYAGLYFAEKGNRENQCCRNHSNKCCRN